MLDLFIGLKRLTKRRTIHIDNAIFRLHWLFTSSILIAFSLILTGRQYVGEPIICMETNNLPKNLINTYCWIQSTFIIPEATPDSASSTSSNHPSSSPWSSRELAHPWIGNSQGSNENVKFQTYYQWVCFVLFFQGILCYFPYYLWKLWEGGLMRLITMGMQIALITDEERGHKRKIVLDYFHRHFTHHRLYAYKYFLCECLCLINICAQIWFTDWFLNGEFIDYGPKVMRWLTFGANQVNYDPKINPMNRMFPRMTKCRFKKYGDSGDISSYDILCMLPLNVVNEKIYLFLWFWMFMLLTLMTIVVLYRLFVFFIIRLRAYFLKSRCRLSRTKSLKLICERGNIGDWFLMYMLANNLDPLIIREITDEMGKRLDKGLIKREERACD